MVGDVRHRNCHCRCGEKFLLHFLYLHENTLDLKSLAATFFDKKKNIFFRNVDIAMKDSRASGSKPQNTSTR